MIEGSPEEERTPWDTTC